MKLLRAFLLATLFAGPIVAFSATGSASQPAAASPPSVIIFLGQSNMQVASTQGVTAPAGSGLGAKDYSASFYGQVVNAALPCAPVGCPSANSGTLIVSSVTSGKVYAGQILICKGCADGTRITSDTIGDGTGNTGEYVVSPAQTIAAGALFRAAEDNVYDPNTACKIWNPLTQTWQAYQATINASITVNANIPDPGGWGPEGQFCLDWLADHPGRSLYMIKYAMAGTSLCPVPAGNGFWSPEVNGLFAFANAEVVKAEASVPGRLYTVTGFVYGQGESDVIHAASGCDAAGGGVNVYRTNLIDLINHLALPVAVSTPMTAAISGTVLHVGAVVGTPLRVGQAISGEHVSPNTILGAQIDGTPGGLGHYNLQVHQVTAVETIHDTTSGATLTGAIAGWQMQVDHITGRVAVGDRLSGADIGPATFVKAYGTGDGDAGNYPVNEGQSVPSEPMTASSLGWGIGADSAKVALFRIRYGSPTSGVQTAQLYVNHDDNPGAANLIVTTINRLDALPTPGKTIHDNPSWVAESGRRLYLGWKGVDQAAGGCDYHSPTC